MSTLRTNFWSRGFRLQDCSANKGAGTAPNYKQDDKLSAVQRVKATVTLLCQGSKGGATPAEQRSQLIYGRRSEAATAGASPAWQVLGTGLPGIITYTVVCCLLHLHTPVAPRSSGGPQGSPQLRVRSPPGPRLAQARRRPGHRFQHGSFGVIRCELLYHPP